MNLVRTLKNGAEYNSLFPDSSCNKVRMSNGDTSASINDMVSQILKFNSQTTKVAPLLKGSNLKETSIKIHDFLYNHFQYKADSEEQLLRSPACAWKTRYNGIDCKSYSIIASCLLLNLGIKHYIRKIKQPTFNAQDFTHVYVIVPIDQKKGNLEKGYYTIDGTLPHTQEPTFVENKDLYMDGLQHYGLNGLGNGEDPTTGGTDTGGNGNSELEAGVQKIDWEKIKEKYLKQISINKLKDIKCWGGTGFNDTVVVQHIDAFNIYIANQIIAIQKGIEDKVDNSVISNYINNINVVPSMIHMNFEAKKGEGWNTCSRGNMEAIQIMASEFATNQKANFLKWVDYYFTNTESTEVTTLIASDFVGSIGMWGNENKNGITALPYRAKNYKIKPDIKDIAVFQFEPYVQGTPAGNSPSFDVASFVSTASLFIPNNAYTNANNQNPNNNTNTPKPNKNGSTALIVGGLALAGFFGFKYFKNR